MGYKYKKSTVMDRILTLKEFLNEGLSENVIRHLKLISYGDSKGNRQEVNLVIHSLGNQKPYFSATRILYKNGRDVAAGANSESMLKAFPKLKPFVDLHNSKYPNGEPMYYAENGFYHIKEGNPEAAKSLWRIEDEEQFVDAMAIYHQLEAEKIDKAEAKKALYDLLSPMWEKQAKEAIDCLDEYQAKYGGKKVGNIEGVVVK